MFSKLNYENFNDYALSLNITQILREYNFKKIGMNSLYHLTHILKLYITDISVRAKDYCEFSNRSEVNLIDVLNSLLDKGITKEELVNYIGDSKLKYPFCKRQYVNKILSTEEIERNSFIKKMNINNITTTACINKEILEMIPKSVKYFPKDFALKETQVKFNVTNEEVKKNQSLIKNIEKKSLEEVISANNYFDNLSKKHKRKNSIDINNLFQDIQTSKNISLGFSLKQEGNVKSINKSEEDGQVLALLKSYNNGDEKDYDNENDTSQIDNEENAIEDY